MQSYKNLAKKLFTSQKNNFAEFAQTTNELTFVDKLQPKTYYETYKDLYFGAKFFAVLAQIATAISSYSFFADLFQTKITNEYLLIGAVLVLLAIIEVMKYLTLNKALLSLFSLPAKPNYILLSFALILSICSIYASVVGGANLGIDMQKVVTVKSEYDTEIATLRSEIKDIQHRNTWLGNTEVKGKEKKLLHTKETAIQALQAKKDSELNKVAQSNENNANTFKIGFALFDLLFLLATLYVWNFIRKVAIEKLANTLDQDNKVLAIENTNISSQTLPNVQNDMPNVQKNAIPNQQNTIGFQYDFTHLKKHNNTENTNEIKQVVFDDNVGTNNSSNSFNDMPNDITTAVNTTAVNTTAVIGNGNRVCLHCEGIFTYKVHNHKYCSETCRIASWELRTGKTFTKPKTK